MNNMNEIGVIKKIDGKFATVAFERTEACEKCRMCNLHKNKTYVSLVVENTLNAEIGQKVNVEMSNQIVLKAAFVVYFIPLILAVIALIATLRLNEIYQLSAIVIAVLIGFFIDYIVDKQLKKSKKSMAKMVNIVKENTENE